MDDNIKEYVAVEKKAWIDHRVRNSHDNRRKLPGKIAYKSPKTLFVKRVIEDIKIRTYIELKTTISDKVKSNETSIVI